MQILRMMAAIALVLGGFVAAACIMPQPAGAQSVDVDAASRGVVRVVLLQKRGDYIQLLGHGTGFAVTEDKVVTNEHVVRRARASNGTIAVGVVPSNGGEGVIASIIDIDTRRDLALLRLPEQLRLQPLTLNMTRNLSSGEVTAVGYPGNVDRAQGLKFADYVNSQPPVKAPGFITGSRPLRDMDTILHTAPIAQGNSGGPLVDRCGRVVGVNTKSAISDGSDAEFFFAVSNAELEPFLTRNSVSARTTSEACKSFAEIEAAENERIAQEKAAAEEKQAEQEEQERERAERIRLETTLAVQDERESKLLFAIALLILSAAGGVIIWRGTQGEKNKAIWISVGTGLATIGVAGAIWAWISRPGFEEIDMRVQQRLSGGDDDAALLAMDAEGAAGAAYYSCTLQRDRSKILSEPGVTVPLRWTESGCVNGKTQYGYAQGEWMRVFVPEQDDVASANSFDPESKTFRMRRYHLLSADMQRLRNRRAEYDAPQCGAEDAAAQLGYAQRAVINALPDQPNELLVYTCEEK